jgi:hypothetical protein
MTVTINLSEAAFKEIAEAVYYVYDTVKSDEEFKWHERAQSLGYGARTSAIVAALLDKNERYWSDWAKSIVCPLKDCPFCGGDAHYGASTNKSEYHEISCVKCNSYMIGENKEIVIRKWNNRI